ncbi:hypothetical protein [Mesotoga prima]|uniref:hypothetical protein n=1 Tax=Mesotoga prima TaxID=1184387 RepID=UPI001E0C0D65|nr:hypothetical protein [Bdellovibrionales bacterium]
MDAIEPRIARFISDQGFYVLRDKATGIALNVSYTPEGLKWTMAPNGSGKLIFFRKAHLIRHYNKTTLQPTKVEIGGDVRPSNKVYVEKFIPTNQPTNRAQKAEYTWTDKAYKMAVLNAGAFPA